MKCKKCGYNIEYSVKSKKSGAPSIMIQVPQTIICPKCGNKEEIQIPFSHLLDYVR